MKKQTKSILFATLGIVLLLVAMKVASSPNMFVKSVDSGALIVSETDWDFGEIPMSEGIVTKTVTLTNNSQTPITLTQMETSCMCTTAQIVHPDGSKSGLKGMVGHGGTPAISESIKSGGTAKLLVNFDPNAHGPNATGPITRDVMLQTNSAEQPEIKLTFSGNVIK